MAKQPEQMEIRKKIEPLASLVWLHGIALLIYRFMPSSSTPISSTTIFSSKSYTIQI